MTTKNESIFMQMHNGTRTGDGSFNQGLKNLFYKADMKNQVKLVRAFPEFFGDEVEEFGVTKEMIDPQANKKKINYKGWQIKWEEKNQIYELFTPDEMEQPAGYRNSEMEVGSILAAKTFIDNY